MRLMEYIIGLSALLLFILSSCSTKYHVCEPIYPKPGYAGAITNVENLQPTFKWKPIAEPETYHLKKNGELNYSGIFQDVTYDLVIYEGIKIKMGMTWTSGPSTTWQEGEKTYYREGIEETEHKVEIVLKPGMVYIWSVRTRKGTNVSSWSRYDRFQFYGVTATELTNWQFMFETPPKPEDK